MNGCDTGLGGKFWPRTSTLRKALKERLEAKKAAGQAAPKMQEQVQK